MTILDSLKPVLDEIRESNNKHYQFVQKAQKQLSSVRTRLKATLTQQDCQAFDAIFDQITDQVSKNQDELDNYQSLLQSFLEKISSPESEQKDPSIPDAKMELQAILTDMDVLLDNFQGLKSVLESTKLVIRKKQRTPQIKQQKADFEIHEQQSKQNIQSNQNTSLPAQTPTLKRIQFNNASTGQTKSGETNKPPSITSYVGQQVNNQAGVVAQRPLQRSQSRQQSITNQKESINKMAEVENKQQSFKERKTVLQLEKELAEVKQKLIDEQYINQKCQNEIIELQSEIFASRSEELERSRHEKNQADNAAQKLAEENQKLRNQLLEVESSIQAVIADYENAIAKVQIYESEIQQKNFTIQQQQSTIQDLESKIKALEAKIQFQEEQKTQSQGELDILRERFVKSQLQQVHQKRVVPEVQSELEDPNDGQVVCKTPQIKKSTRNPITPIANVNTTQNQLYQQNQLQFQQQQYIQPQHQQYQQMQIPMQNYMPQSNYAYQYHQGQQQQIQEIYQLQDQKNKLASIITQLKGCIDTIVNK